jgi:hypothetical protein
VQALAAIVRFIASVFAAPGSPRQRRVGWASVKTSAQRRYLRG